MAILSCHVSIKLPPKISDGQNLSDTLQSRAKAIQCVLPRGSHQPMFSQGNEVFLEPKR